MPLPSGGDWKRLRRFLGWLCVAVLVLAGAAHRATEIHASDVRVSVAGAVAVPAELPYLGPTPDNAAIEVTFRIHKSWLTQRWVVFVPDDYFESLSVDGKYVPLDGVDPERRADVNRGFHFRLGPYLHRGDNTLVARVVNHTGPAGLDLKPDLTDAADVTEATLALVAAIGLLALLLGRLGLSRAVIAIFLAGTAARFAYLDVTPFPVRTHDAAGHLEYVRYVLDHHAVPPPYGHWMFYQPPAYYLVAAGLWRAVALIGITAQNEAVRALQVASVIFQLGFTLVAVRTADLWIDRLPEAAFGRRHATKRAARALCAALICLWPSGIIEATQVGNDDLLYLGFGLGFYFLVRWWLGGRDRDLTWAAAWGAMALWTKSNGILLFTVLAGLCVARMAGEIREGTFRVQAWVRRLWPAAVVSVVAAAGAIGRSVFFPPSGERTSGLVGNANKLNPDLAVHNGLANYLWFDTKTFFTVPFTTTWTDEGGRQFFWNLALKTSLFGEYTFEGAWAENLAVLLSVGVLGLLACCTFAVLRSDEASRRLDLPALLEVALLTASLAALRMAVPMACSGDFRYILPVLGPMAYLYVRGLVRLRELGKTRLFAWARGLGWSFAATSLAFFIAVAAHR